MPGRAYSAGVSPAERAFWCDRAVSALRGALDMLAERDGDPE